MNSRTWHALCSQDGQTTIILQPIFTKDYIAVMEFFRRPTDWQKYTNRVTFLGSSFPPLTALFTSYLHEIISNNNPKTFSRIDNSFQLEKLNRSTLDGNFVLVSLDDFAFYKHSDRSRSWEYFHKMDTHLLRLQYPKKWIFNSTTINYAPVSSPLTIKYTDKNLVLLLTPFCLPSLRI